MPSQQLKEIINGNRTKKIVRKEEELTRGNCPNDSLYIE